MVIRSWPTGPHWAPRQVHAGVSTPKSSYTAPFTGVVQSLGHLADRYRFTLTLPACSPQAGQEREAWLFEVASTGDWVRLPHLHRMVPLGSLRGLPVVASPASAGARTVQITTTPGASLYLGDMLGLSGELAMVGGGGAVADGAGLITVPLVLPLVASLAAGAPVAWQQPTGTFQLVDDGAASVAYARHRWQATLELQFLQVP